MMSGSIISATMCCAAIDKLHSLDISDSTLVNLRERLAVDKARA